jgi:hypothetical protein
MKVEIKGLDKAITNFQVLQTKIDKIAEEITTSAAMEIESEVKLNLSGRSLNIDSGNLISASHATTTQKTGKGYENEIVSSSDDGNGFHYGAYWELEGGRPFMRPAVDVASSKILQIANTKILGIK